MDIGTTLSRYRITAKLGEGGMGEVYRAEDSRLKRDVAIKVLPEALAADPDRLARLEREAQVLAQLEHPNVAAIYGLEEAVPIPPGGGDGGREPGVDGGTVVRFVVMQLAEGETLDELLDQRAGVTRSGTVSTGAVTATGGADGAGKRGRGLPLDEVLPIAAAIADALEAAHDKGIVHRDLKPANVKVAYVDGTARVKVLDFGLAKAFQPDGTAADISPDLSASPTMMAATGRGMIMGTAGYMSPEQARGQRVDRRTDVWAFGVVLYEMLTGDRLFHGATVSDTLAAVLKDDIEIDGLPAGTPLPLRRLLRRCLQRDPRARLKDMGDARLEIAEAGVGPLGDEAPEVARLLGESGDPFPAPTDAGGVAASTPSFGWRFIVAAILSFAAGTLLTWVALSALVSQPDPVRTFIAGPAEARGAVISPDGTKLLLSYDEQLWIRDVGSLDPRPVEGSAGSSGRPFWAPDSSQFAFFVGNDLFVSPVAAGGARRLPYDQIRNFGGVWTADGIIVSAFGYGSRGGLVRLPAEGGEPQVVAHAPGPGFLRHPTVLPDGQTLVYNYAERGDGVFAFGKILLQRGLTEDAGVETLLDEQQVFGPSLYLEPLQLLLVVETDTRALWTIPLARDGRRLEGAPQVLPFAGEQPSYSDTGTFVYRSASERLDFEPFHWVDRSGSILETFRYEVIDARWLAVSPDGTRVAIRAPRERGVTPDVWVIDLETGARTLITAEPGDGNTPEWLDNDRLVYAGPTFGSSRVTTPSDRLLVQTASGAGAAVVVVEGGAVRRPSASPDGRYIVYERFHRGEEGEAADRDGTDRRSLAGGQESGEAAASRGGQRPASGANWDIHYVDSSALGDGDAAPQPFMVSEDSELRPALSPDASRIAFISDASGSSEAWVSTFPEPTELVRISVRGATYVRWSPAGDEIFFDDGEGVLWSVSVDAGAAHGRAAYGQPQLLFAEADLNTSFDYYSTRGWDVGPGGDRFLIVQRYLDDTSQVYVIENFPRWYRERRP